MLSSPGGSGNEYHLSTRYRHLARMRFSSRVELAGRSAPPPRQRPCRNGAPALVGTPLLLRSLTGIHDQNRSGRHRHSQPGPRSGKNMTSRSVLSIQLLFLASIGGQVQCASFPLRYHYLERKQDGPKNARRKSTIHHLSDRLLLLLSRSILGLASMLKAAYASSAHTPTTVSASCSAASASCHWPWGGLRSPWGARRSRSRLSRPD